MNASYILYTPLLDEHPSRPCEPKKVMLSPHERLICCTVSTQLM